MIKKKASKTDILVILVIISFLSILIAYLCRPDCVENSFDEAKTAIKTAIVPKSQPQNIFWYKFEEKKKVNRKE